MSEAKEIPEVVDGTFQRDVLEVANKPVLVEYWAEWCQPCKLQQPIVAGLMDHYGDKLTVRRLEVDLNPNTTQRYNIKGIPTLMVFRDGREVERIVGVVQSAKAIEMIDKYTGAAVVETAEQ